MKSLNLILSTFFCMSVLGCSSNSGSSSGGNNNVEPLDVTLSVDQQQIVIQDKIISVKKVELSRGLSKDTYFEINTGKKYLKFKIEGRDNKLVSKLTSVEEKYFAMVYDESIEEFEIDVDKTKDTLAVLNSLMIRRCVKAAEEIGVKKLVLSKRSIAYLSLQNSNGVRYNAAIRWDLEREEALDVVEISDSNKLLMISNSKELNPLLVPVINLKNSQMELFKDNSFLLADLFNYQCQRQIEFRLNNEDRIKYKKSFFQPEVSNDNDDFASSILLKNLKNLDSNFGGPDSTDILNFAFTYIPKELEDEVRSSPLFKEIKDLDGK